MLKQGVQEPWPWMLRAERVGDLSGEGIDSMKNNVGHLVLFGGPPVLLHDMEVWRIRRYACAMDTGAIEGAETACRFLGATEAVPDAEPRTCAMPEAGLDKGEHILA